MWVKESEEETGRKIVGIAKIVIRRGRRRSPENIVDRRQNTLQTQNGTILAVF